MSFKNQTRMPVKSKLIFYEQLKECLVRVVKSNKIKISKPQSTYILYTGCLKICEFRIQSVVGKFANFETPCIIKQLCRYISLTSLLVFRKKTLKIQIKPQN
jgi:hypothetical protein